MNKLGCCLIKVSENESGRTTYVLFNFGNIAWPKTTKKALIGRTMYVLLKSGAEGVNVIEKSLKKIPAILGLNNNSRGA